METLVIASKNKGKIEEIKTMLGGFYNVISMVDAGADLDVEETGTTFEQNALLKAEAVYRLTGLPSLADDSGIAVDALGGRPGIYSARFAAMAEGATAGGAGDLACEKSGNQSGQTENADKANNRKLLKEMEGVTNRKAKFVCAIVLFSGENKYITGYGETEGELLHAESGGGGFGYDPLFYSCDLKKSFGDASQKEKNEVSHRYRALKDLFDKLNKTRV